MIQILTVISPYSASFRNSGFLISFVAILFSLPSKKLKIIRKNWQVWIPASSEYNSFQVKKPTLLSLESSQWKCCICRLPSLSPAAAYSCVPHGAHNVTVSAVIPLSAPVFLESSELFRVFTVSRYPYRTVQSCGRRRRILPC